jgi:hypothetical protein
VALVYHHYLGDYRVGETLLAESASVITLCDAPPPSMEQPPSHERFSLALPDLPKLKNLFARSRSPSPDPALAMLPATPVPRRMLVVAIGLRPFRKLWTTSARPGESVLKYQLMDGCVAVVVPVRLGAPLLAWHGETLKEIWKISLPPEGDEDEVASAEGVEDSTFEGIVSVLCEFLELCVDWERVKVPDGEDPKKMVKSAIMLLVAGAVRSCENKEVA